MILIFTSERDNFTSLVENKLDEASIPFFRFNLDVKSLLATKLSYSGTTAIIEQNKRSLNLALVKTVWIKKRIVDVFPTEKVTHAGFSDATNFELWKGEWNQTLKNIISYLKIKQVKWVDDPLYIQRAENKSYQLYVAKMVGFSIPETLISNDKNDILSFLEGKEAIIKTQGQPVFCREDEIYFTFTNKLSAELVKKEFDKYVSSPLLLQEYISKKIEVRYTIVKDKHFVCAIDSQKSEKSKIDWRRYDISQTPYFSIGAPKEIQEKVNLFMEQMNLNYGALDFIVDENDKWWFLEINSTGQYGWIEALTGLRITDALYKFVTSNN